MPSKIDHIKGLVQAIGFRQAAEILLRRLMKSPEPVHVHVGSNRVTLRPTNSDLFVMAQIFGRKEYALGQPIEDRIRQASRRAIEIGKTPVVIDAGANVGYSSLYFSDVYPDAHVVSIEPDYETFLVLKQNCAEHPRITPVHAALWRHDNGVNLSNTDADAWARSVSDGGSTPSRTLESILSAIPDAHPLILKLDIEGAEREVVEHSPETVRSFPVIMIEPHDFMKPGSGCLSPLYSAVSGKQYDTFINGENIVLCES